MQNDTYSLLENLHREMGRFFNDENDDSYIDSWRLRLDVNEEPDQYILSTDLPGVDPKDIKLSVDGHALTIRAERETRAKREKDNCLRFERFSGAFYRQITLPDNADLNNIQAVGKNGVLEVTVPKTEKTKARSIEVVSED